ncbi:Lead, cadmium, zinc and mercury transporting ATPase; Copper-translocating P-type ATPase [hydrothermal vent metagenome]|uniref:Lead, cadmium, zinc and mercury transporting ATPase Copper-translocating P-type ATPase n=1 Tax=hydrothermal vent metagenome TaxID=652676 RepID=A0A3B1DB82_9ZZZZ
MNKNNNHFDLPILTNTSEQSFESSAAVSSTSTTLNEFKFGVEGMHCAGCISTVEKALKKVERVANAEVNLATAEACVLYQENEPDSMQLQKAIESCGFKYIPLKESKVKSISDIPSKNHTAEETTRRLLISFPFAIIALIISFSKTTFPGFSDNSWVLLLLTLPVVFFAGMPFYKNALSGLKHRRLDMDSLIALGSGTAFTASLLGTLLPKIWDGEPPIYYDATIMILIFVLFGRMLEQRAKRKTSQAVDGLLALQAKSACRLVEGKEENVPIDELQVDDIILVKPGERIPVDGVVTEGGSFVDESMMTGEAIPVEKQPGNQLLGGTLNQRGRLTFRAERVGNQTMLQEIVNLVRDAQGSKAPIARLADTVSGYFVPIVMAIALLTFSGWMLFDSSPEKIQHALLAAVAVLVVTCPCALGLATPTAVSVAMGRSAQLGVLIQDGLALETAHLIDTVMLDKTGTITAGKPTLTETFSVHDDESYLLQLAASLEQHSEHPIAHAILLAAKEQQLPLLDVKQFQAEEGLGIRGEIEKKNYYVGNLRYLKQQQITGLEETTLLSTLTQKAAEGKTIVLIAGEQQLVGWLAVADPVIATSKNAIETLKQMGVDLWMLSGDRQETAKWIGSEVGIAENRVIAEVLPAGKAEAVKQLQTEGHAVAMVGDGINDAPALAAAEIGMAIGRGNEIALEAGNITLVHDGLQGVVAALSLSRRTMKIIKQNLFFAFFYNLFGIPLAAFGIMPPMFAALAMSLSSVSVVANSLRLRRFSPGQK